MDEGALAAWLSEAAGVPVAISSRTRLSGGAIQQNWRLDVTVGGTPQAWVLRTDAPATLAVSRSRLEEFALLRAAHAAGVPVPEPLFACADPGVTGRPFFVMRLVQGVAAAHRIVRSEELGGGRARLTAALAKAMAQIHSIVPPRPDLGFLGAPDPDPCSRFIRTMRAALDGYGEPRPMLEWGLRHLERTSHAPGEIVLCHNDFRTGNYMVDATGITGILDWEFAAWGDPHEDIGWLCARCWRFGGPGDVGGIGTRADFAAAYSRPIDPARVRWWELAATIRWAVIAIAQAERHVSGREPSLELALTGHIIPELELDVMRQTAA
jgi:aminoglycoside phosphotransferase (APT) family kinase protein